MIIGICGYQGAGKSTICELAINLFRTPWNFKRIGFSDPLYRMLIAAGVPAEIVYDKKRWNEPLDILCGKTTRHACDTLGTDWGQNCIGSDVWSNATMERCAELQAKRITPIVDNVRFPHEAGAIISRGGIIIAFNRHGLVPDVSKQAEKHISEIRVNHCSAWFMNHGHNLQEDAANFSELLVDIMQNKQ